MRKIIVVVFIILSHGAIAQEASVERSVSGIQIGPGIWIHNELKLSNSLALRSELGLDGTYESLTKFIMRPVFTIEPRYYYNLKKRSSELKSIANNSGSFISLNISYHPDSFIIPNKSSILSGIFAAPTWGIRRNLGNHFNYESAIGLGYGYITEKANINSYHHPTFFTLNTHLRIGYRF